MNRILFLISILFLVGCANQTAPTGGPSDKEPPILLNSDPKNNQLKFQGNSIELTFNENIRLKDPKEEILITPALGKLTKFAVRGKKLLITPEKKLLENTTYSISFREGVQDITEGNPAVNLQLAFSTGLSIDSLKINGNVKDVLRDVVPEKVTVAVYTADTFNIFKHTPTYFTFTDKKGRYTLKNLKAQRYYLYAFEDKNKNLKVESNSERFGFKAATIQLPLGDSIAIPLVKLDARIPKINTIRNTAKVSSIRLNKEIDSVAINSMGNDGLLATYGGMKNEINIYHDLKENDSTKIKVVAIDSTNIKLDTTIFIKSVNAKFVEEQFKQTFQKLTIDHKTRQITASLKINKPLVSINPDSIYIAIDTTYKKEIDKKTLRYDTLTNIITFTTTAPKPKQDKKESPSLKIAKSTFVSISNDTSKTMSTAFKILEESETATLSLEVTTKEPNYLIQLIKEDNSIIRMIRNQPKHTFTFLPPDTYKIRVIIDSNGNGKWDAGNFFTRTEPEKIFFYQSTDKKKSIPTRANWEVGPLQISF